MLARTHAMMRKIPTAAGLVFVGGTSAGGNGDAYTSISLTSLTGGIASAPAAGDFVLVVHGYSATSDFDVAITGYTELVDLYANDTEDANMAVAWKLMTATPDTSVTLSQTGTGSDGAATVVHVWRGVHQTTPIDTTTQTATGIDDDTVDSPAITPVTAGAVVLSCGIAAQDVGDAALTAPTGYTDNDIVKQGGTSSRMACAVIGSKVWSGSGAEDPGAWGGGTGGTDASWAAATVVLRPS